MHKLLIVDDEALVREAIREQMNWAALGFECVGDCEDGLEALEWIVRDQPDVVLTDIGMPFMNGIELTQMLSIQYPTIKVVILTGYDDFDFAQQAIKLQAVDYILKPITAAELEKVLIKVKQGLDDESRRNQDYAQLKRQLTESLPLLKERFLERLVTSSMTEKQIKDNCSYFQINWEGSLLIELLIDVDEFATHVPAAPSDQELYRFAVYNIAQEIADAHSGTVTFRDRENRVLILLSGDNPEPLEENAILLAEQIHQALASFLPIKTSIGIGHAVRLSDNITVIHESAISALNYRFILGTNEIIRLSDMERRIRPEFLSIIAWESELITKLKTATPQDMNEWIARLFTAFREHLLASDICNIYLQRILLTLMHTLYEMNSDIKEVFGETKNPVTEINRFTALDEIEVWFLDIFGKAVTAIRSMREDHNVLQVQKAMAYVRQHYTDPELSLNAVCKYISMSASYFSTLFKQHTGKTFVEYVTYERMGKAKELLKLTSMKSYEIAFAVGYSDPQYFSGAFKKHSGDTPTDYRCKMIAEEV